MAISLGELASQTGCELKGSPDIVVDRVASLNSADERSLAFLSNAALKPQLLDTKAAAVIVRPDDAADCPVAAFIADDPYASYARMAALVMPRLLPDPGIHPSAVVDPTASIADSAVVSANAVVEANSLIGEHCVVGAGSVVGPDCELGAQSVLLANVTLARSVTMGKRCLVHPGAVIGSDGFGNAMTPQGWVKVPQVGGVRIGDDVEIGANTTIDCGAIGDTIIADGVRIDNLCMIAHNVQVGKHTAMAGQTGIAGSAIIGERCMLAGNSGVVGHITICDDVILSAQSMATKNIDKPGVYSAGWAAAPAKDWAKQVARLRRLGVLVDRVGKLEKDNS